MDPAFESYVQAWRRRRAEADAEQARLTEEARALVPRLAAFLKSKYGVRRVFLHGSLAEGFFHRGSDIDLAAEGLPPGAALYRAAADLDELARPFRVDLVALEEAHPDLREKILHRGTEIDANP